MVSTFWRVTVSPIDPITLHRRYTQLASRFKASWTFHQFLQGVQKFFVEADVGRYPNDFQEIHTLLKSVGDRLAGQLDQDVVGYLDQAERKLDQMSALLLAADTRVSPALMRQFFERVRNFDDQILAQMVRFYIDSAVEDGLIGDRLDKVDFLLTKLGEEPLPTGEMILRDRTRLREIFQGLWSAFSELTSDPGFLEEQKREFAEIRRGLGNLPDLEQLTASQIVQRAREAKQRLGRFLVHPELGPAVIETNLAIKNKVRQHYHLEEQRILAESQRIFELESKVPIDRELNEELSAFRRSYEEFEKKQRRANVKLEDIAFLRRQVEGLIPRLLRPDPAPGVVPRSSGAHPVPNLEIAPHPEPIRAFLRQIVEGLGGTDSHALPKVVALDREVYHLRLEPREVVAYRRLYVAREGDPAKEGFLLEAAALRLRMNQEAAEITELLDESAVTREAPVFVRARQSTRLADEYVQRFGHLITDAVQDGNSSEAQQLQLLRMRLIRDYSGLWLLVNRPVT